MHTIDLGDDALLTRNQVAELLHCSVRALEREASEGGGIPYVRINERNVRYRLGDVRSRIQSRTFTHRAAELAQQAAQ